MTSVDDVQSYGQTLANQLELLENANIDEDDRRSIRAFVRHEDGTGMNTGTIVSHLNRLRLGAERGDVPLTEMDHEAVDDLLFWVYVSLTGCPEPGTETDLQSVEKRSLDHVAVDETLIQLGGDKHWLTPPSI